MTTFTDTLKALVKVETDHQDRMEFRDFLYSKKWYAGERNPSYRWSENEEGAENRERFVKMREDLKCCDDLTAIMVKFGDDDLKRRDRQYQDFIKNEGYRLGGCRWIGKGTGISFPDHIWRMILGYALQDYKVSLRGEVPQKGHFRPFSLTKTYKIRHNFTTLNAAGVRVMPSWTFAGYCNGSKKNVWFIKRETNHATPVLYEDFPRQKVALQVEFPYQPLALGIRSVRGSSNKMDTRYYRNSRDADYKGLTRLGNWLTGQISDRGFGTYGGQNMFWYKEWRNDNLPTKTGKNLTRDEYQHRNLKNKEYFETEPAKVVFLEFAEKRLKCLEGNYTLYHTKRNCLKLTNEIRKFFGACFAATFLKNEAFESELWAKKVQPLLLEIEKLETSIKKRREFYLGKGDGYNVWDRRGKTEMIKIPKNKRSKTAQYFCGHNIAAYGQHQDMD